jgi:hypothetical protein
MMMRFCCVLVSIIKTSILQQADIFVGAVGDSNF